MKTTQYGLVACAVLVVLALVGGCDSAGSGGEVAYTCSFTLDGTDYVLTEGYTAEDLFDPGANGSLSDGGGFIRIGAVADSVSDMGAEGPHIFLSISGDSSGSYDSTDANIRIFLGSGVDYSTSDAGPDPRTIAIIFPEEVGGTIEGTFSGTLSAGDGPVDVTNGAFVAERLADGAVEVPSWWK